MMVPDSRATKLIIRILLFLAWLLLGAGIFLGVEKPHEDTERVKLNFSSYITDFKTKHNISDAELKSFLFKLQDAVDLGYDIKEQTYLIDWNFMNAFFFAGNVVTTIGYGHIVPATLIGRMLCIFYALVGIPITGLTLRSVGNKISEQIAKLIKLFERRVYNRESEKLEIKTASVAFFILVLIILIPAAGFSDLEGWSYEDSVYFCFITLTTIGFGDFVPGKIKSGDDHEAVKVTVEFLNLIYMVVGLAVMSGVIVSISGVIEEKTKGFMMTDPLEHFNMNFNNNRALKKLGIVGGDNGRPMDDNRPPTSRRTPREAFVPPVPKNRSVSAEKRHFQGPTPIMHLSNANKKGLSSAGESSTRSFHNKVAPLSEPATDMPGAATNPDVHDSLSVDEGSDVSGNSRRGSRRESGRPSSALKDSLAEKRESKNELIVEVQLTPLPTPRSSPVFFQATDKPKDQETSNEPSGSIEHAPDSIRADAALQNETDVSETRETLAPGAQTSTQKINGVDEPIKDPDISTVEKPMGRQETNGVEEPVGRSRRTSNAAKPIRNSEMNGLNTSQKTHSGKAGNRHPKKPNGIHASEPTKKVKLQEQKGRNSLKNR